MDEALSEYLKSHPLFERIHIPMEGMTSFVFRLPEGDKEKVIKPFLEGKYSKVDRAYVEEHFPDMPGHRLYANRLTFDRSPILKAYWEEKIGAELSDEAEVWSKPQKKIEVYGYNETTMVEQSPARS